MTANGKVGPPLDKVRSSDRPEFCLVHNLSGRPSLVDEVWTPSRYVLSPSPSTRSIGDMSPKLRYCVTLRYTGHWHDSAVSWSC
jgi:hypothetical protein